MVNKSKKLKIKIPKKEREKLGEQRQKEENKEEQKKEIESLKRKLKPQETIGVLGKQREEEKEGQSEFSETILQESIDFNAPVIAVTNSSLESSNQNLENSASRIIINTSINEEQERPAYVPPNLYDNRGNNATNENSSDYNFNRYRVQEQNVNFLETRRQEPMFRGSEFSQQRGESLEGFAVEQARLSQERHEDSAKLPFQKEVKKQRVFKYSRR